jgi:hypothetical protein
MKTEKQQTAVEWYAEQSMRLELERAKGNISMNEMLNQLSNVLEKAKEMEKQAHKETWNAAHQAGRFEGKGIAEKDWQTFEGYWEENFKSE